MDFQRLFLYCIIVFDKPGFRKKPLLHMHFSLRNTVVFKIRSSCTTNLFFFFLNTVTVFCDQNKSSIDSIYVLNFTENYPLVFFGSILCWTNIHNWNLPAFIKNISSSTSHKKLLSSSNIYLWAYFDKNPINTNIMKTQICYFMK